MSSFIISLSFSGRHCYANFVATKRMLVSMKKTWSNPTYDTIILDYFFSPPGWVNSRWGEKFFSESLPAFVKKKILKQRGTIWLPRMNYVSQMIDQNHSILSECYDWDVVTNPIENPLYQATELVVDELLTCPDNVTNHTQMRYFDATGPFIRFKPKHS